MSIKQFNIELSYDTHLVISSRASDVVYWRIFKIQARETPISFSVRMNVLKAIEALK